MMNSRTSGRPALDGEKASVKVDFRVSVQTANAFNEYCKEYNETRSNVLRNLLEKFLSKFSHL